MTVKDDLLDLALELYDGESRSGLLCPACKGGGSGERTLWMNRDSRYVLYKCYRAKCSIGGKVNVRNATASERKEELGGKRRLLEASPLPLTAEDIDWLKDKYHLSDEEIYRNELGRTRLHSYRVESRLYIPIFRFDRTVRGYTARDTEGLEAKKAVSFRWHEEEPNLSWHVARASKKLILVEDQFSAIRAGSYMNAAALLGVTLNKDKVDEIIRNGFAEAYLALDADATRKAIKTAIECRSRIKLRIVQLEEDLKDLPRDKLTEFMENL
jgi:hypothetical protein